MCAQNVAYYDWCLAPPNISLPSTFRSTASFGGGGRYNYPDIGSKGIPEDVFMGLRAEFEDKLPFHMAY